MALRWSRFFWTLLGLLFVALAVVVWVRVEPVLNPEVAVVGTPRDDCDLRVAPCNAAFPDGAWVTFEISPAHIPAAAELLLKVRANSIDTRRVEVDFAGVDMNMGFNRVPLDSVGPGEFAGSGMLPVCVRSRMTWEAKVLLHTDAGLLAAPFRFDTYSPGREPSAAPTSTGND